MTFDASIPLTGDSPALFPNQSQTNFARLQALVSADHQFNITSAANDGYHNLVHMQIPNPLPTGALASLGRLYAKTVSGEAQLHYMDSAGVEYQITPDSSNSSLAFKGSVVTTGSPQTILLGSVIPNYTGILTVIRAGSSDGFKTFTLYKDAFGDNSSQINSSGASFSCSVSFTVGGDLQINVSQFVTWTLNAVKIS